MDSIEKSGKTVEEAIKEALEILKCEKAQVDIKVLEEGSKGFLGLGGRLAKVLVTMKSTPKARAHEFLKEMTFLMGINIDVEIDNSDDRHMNVNLIGDNLGILIGKRGQTLDSIQYLLNLVVNKGDMPYISITLDTENYRTKRKEALENLARNLAKKAKSQRRSVVLEPMNPYERRIIHAALQNDRQVSTYSQGDEPFRNVVIAPKYERN
ncbi:MAG: protein jag [Defluviitaleaceae bacterium]|nr:protein jag [Defluviitaleaceae bacterium]